MKPPEIRQFEGRLLSGLRREMSFSEDRTSELWREFRSRVSGIKNRIGTYSYSVKVYGYYYSFSTFDPEASFEKWAAVEVSQPGDSFETLELPAGQYAVFMHHGPAVSAPGSFGYIFGTWLPNSEFKLDVRPHFEVLSAEYDPFDQKAEEEIWIPIKPQIV